MICSKPSALLGPKPTSNQVCIFTPLSFQQKTRSSFCGESKGSLEVLQAKGVLGNTSHRVSNSFVGPRAYKRAVHGFLREPLTCQGKAGAKQPTPDDTMPDLNRYEKTPQSREALLRRTHAVGEMQASQPDGRACISSLAGCYSTSSQS